MARRLSGGERGAFWRKMVQRQRESGLSVARFCRREGLKPVTFYAWRRRLQDEATSSRSRSDGEQAATGRDGKGLQLVPIQLVGQGRQEPSCVEVVAPGGFVVRIPEDATDGQVRRVLQLLRELR